jgi:hypothetical protein
MGDDTSQLYWVKYNLLFPTLRRPAHSAPLQTSQQRVWFEPLLGPCALGGFCRRRQHGAALVACPGGCDKRAAAGPASTFCSGMERPGEKQLSADLLLLIHEFALHPILLLAQSPCCPRTKRASAVAANCLAVAATPDEPAGYCRGRSHALSHVTAPFIMNIPVRNLLDAAECRESG